MDELRLEVTEFIDIDRWRWRLTDPHGAFKADHQVSLNRADPEYEAFGDLYFYLRYHAEPHRRLESEANILDRLGRWISEKVLGSVAEKIVDLAPVLVRVHLPEKASGLLYRPLELGHVKGRAIAVQDVSLVFEIGEHLPVGRKIDIHEKLRMLAIFSLPTETSALGLRRERYALKRLIHAIIQTKRKAIDLRILQYGVTKDRLKATLEEGEGWDLIHFSGHGLPTGLLLEKPDGTRDPISTRDLEAILRPARPRLKLVTLSACESAAPTLRETFRWLNLYEPRREGALSKFPNATIEEELKAEVEPLPTLARALVEGLDCAVLAMRYPVGDDFAIELAAHLYRGLLEQRRTLPAALQLALPKSLPEHPQPGVPPLSVATPALFGARAANLNLIPPDHPPTGVEVPLTGLAYFPREPKHFVGRVGPMARASAAIGPESGKTGILFYGMVGAGKTACALELAYRYETGRFRYFAWHKAPDEGADIEGALARLALDFEKQFHNQLLTFPMAHVVDRKDDLAAFLPRLTKLLEDYSILIVLDNLESLLTPTGEWRDERWGMVVDALLAHNGLSRTILTSRRLPKTLERNNRVQGEPIHALSLTEAVLLARELPNLGRLLRGEGAVGLATGRELVARALDAVQGHPKLIELAEAQAANPGALVGHLERAAKEWAARDEMLGAYFQEGESLLNSEDFLKALAGWTRGISEALSRPSRILFHLLCCLEEHDRMDWILRTIWPVLWQRLNREGAPPDLATALEPVIEQGLANAEKVSLDEKAGMIHYHLHPGVANSGLEDLDPAFRQSIDQMMTDLWFTGFAKARDNERLDAGQHVLPFAPRIVPYLVRQHHWGPACEAISYIVQWDPSWSTLAAFLPIVKLSLEKAKGTKVELWIACLLGFMFRRMGRTEEAEEILRDSMRDAERKEQFSDALFAASQLFNLLRDTLKFGEALDVNNKMSNFWIRANLGPWTKLGLECGRLRIWNANGEHRKALIEVRRLRKQMRGIPKDTGKGEMFPSWNVKEMVLDIWRQAALGLGKWSMVLRATQQIVRENENRAVSRLVLAWTRHWDYGPLIQLKRYPEAQDLILECRGVFEGENDLSGLTHNFMALAEWEDAQGRIQPAIDACETSLRYSYLSQSLPDCVKCHYNMARYLDEAKRLEEAAAHNMAAMVIEFQAQAARLRKEMETLPLEDLSTIASLSPPSFGDLCRIVERVEGARFRELFDRLPRLATTGDEAISGVIRLAQEILLPRTNR